MQKKVHQSELSIPEIHAIYYRTLIILIMVAQDQIWVFLMASLRDHTTDTAH